MPFIRLGMKAGADLLLWPGFQRRQGPVARPPMRNWQFLRGGGREKAEAAEQKKSQFHRTELGSSDALVGIRETGVF